AAPLADAEPGLTIENVPGPYCRSKFLAEQKALEAAKRGLPVVVVNPTLPVGPGDRFLTPPTRMLVLFLNGDTPAYLDFDFNMIDVRVAALGHILAAERGRIGERYILGGENLRLATLLDMLEELSGLPMPQFRIPYWIAFAFAGVSELVADRVTHRYPAAPVNGVRLARTPTVFDSSKAASKLGLPIHGIHQALADAIAWLADNGHLKRTVRAPHAAFAERPSAVE
ncbi:MAG: NAD-dependent dehydratase, partial [Rhodospirillales bacterium]|nr:NAD-dependent dehydratase [Rhodospirillales bacterium]